MVDLHHATPQGFDWVAGRGVVAQFFFPTGRTDLDPEDLDVANRLAAHLRAQIKTDRVELAINGHADYRASIEYNKQLGMRRAKSVARALNVLLRTEPNFSLFSALSAGEQYAAVRRRLAALNRCPCPYRKLYPAILVMQSAEDRLAAS